ncbi:PucR family transcriptional regulator [Oerskovia jenensis]|uniref:PucR family transcriptional regulator n=1 Tax=Oerskovia jenensis TaxID=162169 RepID=UPI0036D82183
MLTVRDLRTLPVLAGARAVAGEAGLDRAIRAVNVMEVPDIEEFVRPDELLLTTTYPLRDRVEDLPDLITALHRRGLAALAVKTGRYLAALPPDVLARADALGFPILVLPESTAFNEVIGAVLAVVLAEYGADPARAEAIRERLTGVALAGGGLDEIARTLAGALARPVAVSDTEHRVLGASGLAASTHPALDDSEADAWWRFPVTIAGRRRGQVLVGGADEPTLGQRRLIRQACFAAGMHMAQAVASAELDRRMRALFLEELVSGTAANQSLLRDRGRLFGWDAARSYVVAIADAGTDPGESGDLAATCSTPPLPAGSIVWSRGRELVALVAWSDGLDLESTAEGWQCALAAAWKSETTVACGTVARSAHELASSHGAARESLSIARATGRTVVTQHMVRLERLLLAAPGDRLDSFVVSELGPLVEADRAGGARLCETLEAYLATGNAAEAARGLFIHYNTMKHRIARIEEILSVDLRDPRHRLSLAVALRIRQLR